MEKGQLRIREHRREVEITGLAITSGESLRNNAQFCAGHAGDEQDY